MIKETNATLRQEARILLDGRWFGCVSVSLTLLCVNFTEAALLSLFGISRKAFLMSLLVGFVLRLLTSLLEDGGLLFFLRLKRKENASLSDLIEPYRREPDRFLIVSLIRCGVIAALAAPLVFLTLTSGGTPSLFFRIFVPVWSAAAAVLSVWFCLVYSMSELILLDDRRQTGGKSIGALEAMRTSRRLMRGSRLKLLRLFLSFIGYGFLCLLTAGIATVWVLPYLITTLVMFYEALPES